MRGDVLNQTRHTSVGDGMGTPLDLHKDNAAVILDNAADAAARSKRPIVEGYLRAMAADLRRPIEELEEVALRHREALSAKSGHLSEYERLTLAEPVWRSEALASRIENASRRLEVAKLGVELARTNEEPLRAALAAKEAAQREVEGRIGRFASIDLATGAITR